jgi:hypothetical protein
MKAQLAENLENGKPVPDDLIAAAGKLLLEVFTDIFKKRRALKARVETLEAATISQQKKINELEQRLGALENG